jgi:hypothetical protein
MRGGAFAFGPAPPEKESIMEDGNNWGALLVMWLLGAPLLGALVLTMMDGTRQRARNSVHDRGPRMGQSPPPVR